MVLNDDDVGVVVDGVVVVNVENIICCCCEKRAVVINDANGVARVDNGVNGSWTNPPSTITKSTISTSSQRLLTPEHESQPLHVVHG